MNWLITGGCGFIGRALSQHLLAENAGHRLRVFDNLSVGDRQDLATVADFEEIPAGAPWRAPLALCVGDILDESAILQAASDADICIHLAANTGVGPSVDNPRADCMTNVQGTLNVLEAVRHQGVPRLVFASSGAPLGVQTPPLHEEMAPHPASPYGASKLAGEGYCSAYFHSYGVDTVVLRFGNVYGEGSGKKQSVVAKFIKQALSGQVLEIYGDGSQTRDFIHISDLIRAIVAAATVPGIGGEVFQIATAAETTVGDLTARLVQAIEDETGMAPRWINGESRRGDVARNYSDTRKARARLGWQPDVSLDAGLRHTVRAFVAASNSRVFE